ncbi:MAG: hypothetical protein P8P74_04510 [Crocinitomicaceae bacterium]|nr:hypothetical protein [Crocinitomicaceae bacterium]
MKTVILLAIFCTQFLAFHAVSQNRDAVFPFEDYRKCYTGFKNAIGDTVHEAKFLSVYPIYSNVDDRSNYCWVVEEGGRFGLLNPKGEYVLQSQYDTIFRIDGYSRRLLDKDWLMIGANGRIGVIDYKGKEILPSDYQHIEPYERWLRARNFDGKVGLLDSLLQIDVPFEFDEIYFDVAYNRSLDTTVFHPHFYAKKNGYFGLMNADLSPILPFVV